MLLEKGPPNKEVPCFVMGSKVREPGLLSKSHKPASRVIIAPIIPQAAWPPGASNRWFGIGFGWVQQQGQSTGAEQALNPNHATS